MSYTFSSSVILFTEPILNTRLEGANNDNLAGSVTDMYIATIEVVEQFDCAL